MGRIRINPEPKKLNMQKFTRQPIPELEQRPSRYGQLGGSFQEQYRVNAERPTAEPDPPASKSYYVPWDTHRACALSKEEYDHAIARRAEREATKERAEQKRKNIERETERVRLAHEAHQLRLKEDAEAEEKRKQQERDRQSASVESGLLASSIQQFFAAYDVTPDEQKAVLTLARNQGLVSCTEIYPELLQVVRQKRTV